MIDESLIYTYLSGKASLGEIEEVLKWIEQSPINKKEFLAYKKIWALSATDTTEKKQVWRQIQRRISSYKRFRRRRQWYYATAACIMGVAMLTVVFNKDSMAVETVLPDSKNEIVLELEDGTKSIIKSDNTKTILHNGLVVGVQNGQRIEYAKRSDSLLSEQPVYNTLYVPHGKKFTIELSDSTVVNLNSGSRLKYPVQFSPNHIRQVFLEGEAYFNVTKNTEQAFVVNTDNLKTKVYGTQFNISSYPSNIADHVVLVEGKIGVSFQKLEETILEPNELISVDKRNWVISEAKVDIRKYIAWKDGVLWFDAEPFQNITKTLERHYNVIIVNKMEYLDTIKFTGTFENNESIEEILAVFADYKSFRFKKENNLITIY